jgi:4-diphosphocytidyl-2-C-methyl-D-erythritol kinase
VTAADAEARRTLRCSAPAKINLCLFVGPVRESDGRHELVTVFQPLDLVDLIDAQLDETLEGDLVICPGVDGDNLASAALAAYRTETGWDGPPIRLTIDKRIPVAGGMAGGSADAAAALRIAAAFAGDTDRARLEALALPLGADVPSQVHGRRSTGTGAGESLRRSAARADWEAVILPIDAHLSAGAVYAEADRVDPPRGHDEMRELNTAVHQAERSIGVEQAGLAINDLQTAARRLCPDIDRAIGLLEEHGAEHAMVSGSGPTVVGLFAPGTASAVQAAISIERPAIRALPERAAELEPPRWP